MKPQLIPNVALVVDDVFTDETHKMILDEAVKQEKKFVQLKYTRIPDSSNQGYEITPKDIAYQAWESLCSGHRDFVRLLASFIANQKGDIERDYEMRFLSYRNGDKMGWHDDGIEVKGNMERIYTAVYFLTDKFQGGEIEVSDSVLWCDAPLEGNQYVIPPKQNRLVILPSKTVHRVRPVSCKSDKFENARNVLLIMEFQQMCGIKV